MLKAAAYFFSVPSWSRSVRLLSTVMSPATSTGVALVAGAILPLAEELPGPAAVLLELLGPAAVLLELLAPAVLELLQLAKAIPQVRLSASAPTSRLLMNPFSVSSLS